MRNFGWSMHACLSMMCVGLAFRSTQSHSCCSLAALSKSSSALISDRFSHQYRSSPGTRRQCSPRQPSPPARILKNPWNLYLCYNIHRYILGQLEEADFLDVQSCNAQEVSHEKKLAISKHLSPRRRTHSSFFIFIYACGSLDTLWSNKLTCSINDGVCESRFGLGRRLTFQGFWAQHEPMF